MSTGLSTLLLIGGCNDDGVRCTPYGVRCLQRDMLMLVTAASTPERKVVGGVSRSRTPASLVSHWVERSVRVTPAGRASLTSAEGGERGVLLDIGPSVVSAG